MKKAVSRILYAMFFLFVAMFAVSCIMLMENSIGGDDGDGRNLRAVRIDDSAPQVGKYKRIEAPDLISEDMDGVCVSHYGYDALTDSSEAELYDRIARSVYNISEEPDENGKFSTRRIRLLGVHLSEAGIRRSLNAFLSDSPHVFWLDNLFGYAYSGNDTIVECYSLMDSKDCDERIGLLSEKVNEILSGLNPLMDSYEKERFLHDKLLMQCQYKDGVSGISDGWQYFTSYGALINGEAVCEGYAKAIQILMLRSGIPCYIVRGTADGVEHMWDIVQISDSWYHLDSTWDDNEDIVGYEYFNVTTEMIMNDHIISPLNSELVDRSGSTESSNFFLPECNSEQMNYYTVESFLVEGFDSINDDMLINYIVTRVKDGSRFLPIRISDELDYDQVVDKLFYSSPYKFYYYIDVANERLKDSLIIERDGIRILKNESKRTLRVRVNLGGDAAA